MMTGEHARMMTGEHVKIMMTGERVRMMAGEHVGMMTRKHDGPLGNLYYSFISPHILYLSVYGNLYMDPHSKTVFRYVGLCR